MCEVDLSTHKNLEEENLLNEESVTDSSTKCCHRGFCSKLSNQLSSFLSHCSCHSLFSKFLNGSVLLSHLHSFFQCQNIYLLSLLRRKLSCDCRSSRVSKLKYIAVIMTVLVIAFLYWHQSESKSTTVVSKILVKLEQQDMMHSAVIFTLCFTVVSLPFMWGYIVFNLAAGYFHGFIWGLLVVVCSVGIGTFLNHFICKYYFSTCAVNCMKSRDDYSKIQALLNVLDGPSGIKIIALLRLTPIPFGLQNALVAISNVPIRQYMMASTVGLFPTQALNCYLGSHLRSIKQLTTDGVPGGYVLFIFQIFAGILLTRFVVKRAKRELDLALAEITKEQDSLYQNEQDVLTSDVIVAIETQPSKKDTG